MKTRGSEEITLREGLASKSTVKYSGFARFEKDLRGGERGREEGRKAKGLCGVGCVEWGWDEREGGASLSGTQTVQSPRVRRCTLHVWRLRLRRCSAICGAATGPGLPRWQEVRRLREGRCTVGCGAQLSGATPKGQQSEIFS